MSIKEKPFDYWVTQKTRAILFLIGVSCALLSFNCTTTQPVPRYTKKETSSQPPSRSSIIIPEGWLDITSQSAISSILLWIVNEDNSASMVLKEFQADDSTRKMLLKEDVCFVANISLRLKMADDSVQRRITRAPETVAKGHNSCTYVFEEKGLLHRVIVYKKNEKYFELELSQENSSKPFEMLTMEQMSMANALRK